MIYHITFHHAHNFGAMLQIFALQQYVNSMGEKSEIIDFSEKKSSIFRKDYLSLNIKKVLQCIADNVCIAIHYKENKKAYKSFEDFYNIYFIKTKKFHNYEELENYNWNKDLLIAGSDQLWKIDNDKALSKYNTLKFGKGCFKCTFAVSICENSIKKEYKDCFISSIKDFKYISMREKKSKLYLEECKMESTINLDPVFLLCKEEWESMIPCKNSNNSEKYILCYDLIKSKKTQSVMNKLKTIYGYKVVVITTRAHTELKADVIIRSAGPIEFLKMVRNAEIVVTTSYHGTAFSIIFEKVFYSILTDHSPYRIEELLDFFDMKDRLVYEVEKIIKEKVDYSKVRSLLEGEQQASRNYIQTILYEYYNKEI